MRIILVFRLIEIKKYEFGAINGLNNKDKTPLRT